jgi:hypothetical protein
MRECRAGRDDPTKRRIIARNGPAPPPFSGLRPSNTKKATNFSRLFCLLVAKTIVSELTCFLLLTNLCSPGILRPSQLARAWCSRHLHQHKQAGSLFQIRNGLFCFKSYKIQQHTYPEKDRNRQFSSVPKVRKKHLNLVETWWNLRKPIYSH